MPQTYYFSDGGELDFIIQDLMLISLSANFSLNTVPSSWTQSQTFRIVIIPASFNFGR
jgi:hypothetical protein